MDATLRERIRGQRLFKALDKGEIRLFLGKIFELLLDKCVTLNSEKMAHIQMFLEKFPNIGASPTNLPLQRLVDSISRCTRKQPEAAPVKTESYPIPVPSPSPVQTPKPSPTNDSEMDVLTEHHHMEFSFSFKVCLKISTNLGMSCFILPKTCRCHQHHCSH